MTWGNGGEKGDETYRIVGTCVKEQACEGSSTWLKYMEEVLRRRF